MPIGKKRSSVARDLLLIAVTVTLWVMGLEAGLHLAGLKVEGSLYAQDRIRRFRLRPLARAWYTEESETLVAINSRGFRDRERSPGPHPGIFRVAVIGDSSVAGLQVTEPEMFTQVAERALGAQVEVLNFGVPNYGLAQQYLTLRDDVFAYQPDLVVDAVSLTNAILNSTRETCVNDSPYPYFVEQGGQLELYDPHFGGSLSPAAESALLDAENRSDLALLFFKTQRVVKGTLEGLKQKAHLSRPLPGNFYERSLVPSGERSMERTWRISERTLGMMRDLCQSRHVPFWIITMDTPGQVDPDTNARRRYLARLGTADPYYADNRLVQFAARESIPYIQSAPVLAAYAARTGQCLHGFFNTPRNYGHLNATGHEVAGHLMAERLKPAAAKALPDVLHAFPGAGQTDPR